MGDWGQRDGGPIDRHLRVINKEARVGDRRCLVGAGGRSRGPRPGNYTLPFRWVPLTVTCRSRERAILVCCEHCRGRLQCSKQSR